MAASNVPPLLAVSTNGVGALSDQHLNTYVQGSSVAATLRGFTGLSGMNVWLIGIATANDGGQGMFYWSATATAPDDNQNVIAPYGLLQGRWLRQSSAGATTIFPTIAALRANAADPPISPVVFVEGYYVGADGGEGNFWFKPTDTTSTDNGGTIIVDAAGQRWYRERNMESLNIFWFGIPIGGDSQPALASALAVLVAQATGGGAIRLQSFKHTLLSAVAFTFPSGQKPFRVTLIGDGEFGSTLYWPNSNGIQFTASDPSHTFSVRDMALTTGSAAAFTGFAMHQSAAATAPWQSEFARVTFQGNNIGTEYWATAIAPGLQSQITYDTVLINGVNAGIGVSLLGDTVGHNYSIVHNFDKCGFFGLATGLLYGDYVQGVTVSQSNFTNGTNGVVVASGVTGILSQLAISDSQFNTAGDQISVGSLIGQLSMTGNLLTIPANHSGVYVATGGTIAASSIIGNQFDGASLTGSTGVFADGAIINATINGNVIGSMATGIHCSDTLSASTQVVVTGNVFGSLTIGTFMGTATSHFNVQANTYNAVGTIDVNNGTANNVGTATP